MNDSSINSKSCNAKNLLVNLFVIAVLSVVNGADKCCNKHCCGILRI